MGNAIFILYVVSMLHVRNIFSHTPVKTIGIGLCFVLVRAIKNPS